MKKSGILILVIAGFVSLFLLYSKDQVIAYGDKVSLKGKVELREYSMPTGDKLEAYILILTDSIQTQQSDDFKYGIESMMLELHLDRDHEELVAYKNKVVSIKGRIRPSENTHHLGHACIYEIEIGR